MREPYLWRMANMSRRTCVVVKQIQSNPIGKTMATLQQFKPLCCNRSDWEDNGYSTTVQTIVLQP